MTGADGFIGSAVVNELSHRGIKIYGLVHPNSPNHHRIQGKAELVFLPMEEYRKLETAIKEPVDCVFHFAWQGIRGEDRQNTAMQQQNLSASMQLLQTAKNLGAECFISAGSQAEYGAVHGDMREDGICKPDTAYGKYKIKTLEQGMEFARKSSMRFYWMRVFSVYGELDNPKTLIMSAIADMLLDKDIALTACVQQWDYTYIEDVARAFCEIAESKAKSGAYNLSAGDIRPLKDYMLELKEITHSNSALHFGAVPYGEMGPVNLCPSIEKIGQELKWNAQTTFEQGIKNILEFIRNEKN